MREFGVLLLNYGLFALAAVVLASLQSSLWLQFFGYFPAPHAWIPLLCYWTLYRRPLEGIVMVYLITLVASALTVMPLGMLLLSNIFLFGVGYLIKQRFQWSGSVQFMFVCGFLTFIFPILHLALSWLFESSPIIDFQFFQWLMRTLLTALVALPCYRLFIWFDKISQRELTTESADESI